MKIEVYSDGSATTKDKPGGYGFVIVIDGEKKAEGSGNRQNSTNNDMELEGAIQGLLWTYKYLNERPAHLWVGTYEDSQKLFAEVTLVSDSQIVLNWASGKNKFKQQDKMQKYTQLRALMQRLNAKTRWVEGHSGDEHNERCDKMAGEERDRAMGREPRKKSTKSTLMLKALKEIAIIAKQGYDYEYDPKFMEIAKLCSPFLGKQ